MRIARKHLLQLVLLVLLLGGAGAGLGGQETGAFRVTGVTVDAGTGEVVPRSRLEATYIAAGDGQGLLPATPAGLIDGPSVRGRGRRMLPRPAGRPPAGQTAQVEARADGSGHFTLLLPRAGQWRVTATAAGYRQQAYLEHGNYSAAMVVTEAAPAMDVRFPMMRNAVVSGLVLDDAGEAVTGAMVVLEDARTGEGAAANRRFTQTDDRGHYELAGLAAGEYRLVVQARPWYAAFDGAGAREQRETQRFAEPSLDVVYAPTWFPGTADREKAVPLRLVDGEERTADLHMTAIQAAHVVVPAMAQSDVERGMERSVTLAPVDGGIGNGPVFNARGSGSLEFSGLPPGRYNMRTMLPGGGTDLREIEVGEGGMQTVAAAAAATTQVTVHVEPAGGGEVQFVRADGGEADGGETMRMPGGGMGAPRLGAVEKDVRSLEPGRYLVQAGGQGYVAGVSGTGAAIAGRLVTVGTTAADVTVRIGNSRGVVHGTVTDGGKPVVAALVLMVPATLGQPGGLTALGADESNTDGSFDIGGLVPGEYILVAIREGWPLAWSDPAVLVKYLTRGVPMQVVAGSAGPRPVEAQPR